MTIILYSFQFRSPRNSGHSNEYSQRTTHFKSLWKTECESGRRMCDDLNVRLHFNPIASLSPSFNEIPLRIIGGEKCEMCFHHLATHTQTHTRNATNDSTASEEKTEKKLYGKFYFIHFYSTLFYWSCSLLINIFRWRHTQIHTHTLHERTVSGNESIKTDCMTPNTRTDELKMYEPTERMSEPNETRIKINCEKRETHQERERHCEWCTMWKS